MRVTTLLATIPAAALLLTAFLILMPKELMTPLTVWLLIEAVMAYGLALFFVLQTKYHIGKMYPLFFLVLLISLGIVISYIPWSAQFYAYLLTASATLFIYLRILREFRRRGYA